MSVPDGGAAPSSLPVGFTRDAVVVDDELAGDGVVVGEGVTDEVSVAGAGVSTAVSTCRPARLAARSRRKVSTWSRESCCSGARPLFSFWVRSSTTASRCSTAWRKGSDAGSAAVVVSGCPSVAGEGDCCSAGGAEWSVGPPSRDDCDGDCPDCEVWVDEEVAPCWPDGVELCDDCGEDDCGEDDCGDVEVDPC
ncbi:hypothetical protein [Klenkia marina]|uniref:hypothetical protein n=1 Tax=Klenkia marina TaxID=1960309 RepID=UPI00105A48EE|nr:hypothetical protein [Klenkia marina]